MADSTLLAKPLKHNATWISHVYNIVSLLIIAIGLCEIVWGLLQILSLIPSGHNNYAATGSFYNPGPYGCFIGVIVPLAVGVIIGRRPTYLRIASVIYLAGACFILPGTMSRTGWIAAIVGSLIALYPYLSRSYCRLGRLKKLSVVIFSSILIIGAALFSYNVKRDSADGRFLIWKIAAIAAIEAPAGGVGWNNVAGAYGDSQERYFKSGNSSETEKLLADAPQYVFNEYLQIAIAFGIAAAIFFIILIILSISVYFRRGMWGLAGCLSAIAMVCMASYPFQFIIFKVILIILIACGLLGLRPCRLGMGASIAAICAGGAFISVTPACNINSQLMRGRNLFFDGRHKDSIILLQSLLHKTSDPLCLIIIGKNYEALDRPDSAEHYYQRAAFRVPNRHYPHYLLMNLYQSSGQSENAVKEASYLLTNPPKIPSSAITDMQKKAKAIINLHSAYDKKATIE